MRRRLFLALASLSATVPVFGAMRAPVRANELEGDPFTLGVASGDPAADSISLWTRLAPRPLDDGGIPMRPAEVDWEISECKNFSRIVRKGRSIAWPEYGHVVKPRVAGLAPGQAYHYRFRFGRFESRVGRFRTAPAADDDRAVRIGVVSCNRFEDGWFHAFRHLMADDVDFVFHAGDYIYEKASRGDRMRSHVGDECHTLADYRRRYAQYRLDPDLQDLHAATPFVATWDDHEVSGNWAGLHDRFGTPEKVFAVRHAAAFQAYWEVMPFDVPAIRPGGELRLYRAIRYGANLDLIVLDSRQYRDDQACGDGSPKPLCPEADDPDRTMLGDRQVEWLRERLAASGQHWPVIGRQVPSFRMDYGPGELEAVSMDKWDGYPHAQQRFDRMLADAARPPVTLAGDAHAHFAAQRRDPVSGRPFGADVVATSVTSGGDGRDKDPRWPILQAENPDIQYHSKRRGYVLVEARRSGVEMEFRTLDRITTRDHSLFRSAIARLDEQGRVETENDHRRLREVAG